MRQWFACIALMAVGAAEAASPITDRFHLRAAYFSGSVATDMRLDPTAAQPGTELDGEEDLGLDDRSDQGRVELMFRLGERNRIRLDFFELDRSGEAVLERQIVFGDEVFQIGEEIESALDLRMLTFTWAYSLVKRERFELGAGLGVHLVETEARGEVAADFQREEESQAGALPSLALDLAWSLSPRMALVARGQYFTASVDEFDGSFADYHVDLQYRLWPNLAFGLGYSLIDVELDVTDPDESGRLDMSTQGPEIFFRVSY
jgi:hypothetical protein